MFQQRIKLDTLVVVLLFIGGLLFAGGFLTLSWYTGARNAQESAAALHASSSAAVDAQLQAFFDRPRFALNSAFQALRTGVLEGDDADAVERYLLSSVRGLEGVTNLSFAWPDGRYINAYRDWDAPSQVHISQAGQDGVMRSYRVDADGQRTELLFQYPGFFPEQRPWYRQAIARGNEEPVWFPAYLFHSGEAIAIGLARAVRDDAGELQGVLVADTSLQEVSRLLSALPLPDGSAAFLLDEQDRLLADSSGVLPVLPSAEGLQRMEAALSPVPSIREAARYAARANFPRDAQSHLAGTVIVQGRAHLTSLQTISAAHGLQLVFGISAPRAAYTAPLISGLQKRLLLTAGLLLLGLPIGLWLARRLSRSLSSLVRVTSSMAAGDLKADIPRSRIQEIDSLALSFTAMQQRLGNTLDELEQRVEARTEELAMANARLSTLSRTDALTEVANRRAFDEALVEYWDRAQAMAQPLSVVMLDVDLFKDYNDHNGHPAGDRCLSSIAGELRSIAEERYACIARYGGEEFVLLLPNCEPQEALHIAEMLRRRVQALAIPHRDSPHQRQVTISAGVSTSLPGEPDTEAQRLVDEADAALYEAKARGRNQVVVFDRAHASA